ncbi:unnamed protein product [Spirodela intermedia]|uniref:Uncharacterized protein n=1 Tax=Spirodela intermedia TaxID=51605 RepID=A0ABN7ECL3_SPIIN|nr:unnamed protein product [Spirodela intermedia]
MPYSQEKLERPSTRGYLYPKPTQCRKVKEVGDLMTGEPATKAPVNGGRNYNGPKVAKFLVGFPRAGRRLALECKGRRELDCKTHPSSRDESRP